jgi:hypothetical protein
MFVIPANAEISDNLTVVIYRRETVLGAFGGDGARIKFVRDTADAVRLLETVQSDCR